MARMQAHLTDKGTVLGPCPGCELWTVEYTNDVALSYAHRLDIAPWHAAVEKILEDHMAECPGLQEIVYNTL